MRFRMCVGTLALTGLLAACGGRAEGGFHPDGRATGDRPAGAAASNGAAGTAAPGSAGTSGAGGAAGGGGAQPETPQAALAAYREYQHVYEQVYETGDPAPLRAVATDPQLSLVTKDVRDVWAQGIVWRFHNAVNPQVQGRSPDDSTVVILDCVQTLGAYRYSAKTGKRLGAWRGGSSLYQAIMKYNDGSWKISQARQGRKC